MPGFDLLQLSAAEGGEGYGRPPCNKVKVRFGTAPPQLGGTVGFRAPQMEDAVPNRTPATSIPTIPIKPGSPEKQLVGKITIFKVGLNADSQWNPVHNAFHRIFSY